MKNARSGTDVAALFAAIVAVAVSPLSDPGPYTIINVAISAAALFTVVGYAWSNKRNLIQSLAVASVLGLVAIPLFGSFSDLVFPARNDGKSWVESTTAFYIWLSVSACSFLLDRRRQSKQQDGEETVGSLLAKEYPNSGNGCVGNKLSEDMT